MTTVLVTGADGQLVGSCGGPIGRPTTIDRARSSALDITDAAAVDRVVGQSRPDVIVNAAAYTAVDRAEDEEALADAVNGEAVGHLAAAADECRRALIHLSTDYVFDGTNELVRRGRPARPDRRLRPLKAAG